MSEPTALPEQVPDLGAGRADSPERPGAMLRAAREAKGLHIGALAVALKVPVRKLEALEADRLSELPDMVFARGLAASICRALNIPDAPILAKLPQRLVPRLSLEDGGLNATYRVKGQRTEASIAGQLLKPPGIAVLALLIAGLVIVFFPFHQVLQSQDDVAAVPLETPGAAPLNPPAEARPQLADTPASGAGAAALPGTPPASALALVEGPASRSGLLVLQARGLSWVEVTDAKGEVQLRKHLSQGDVHGFSAALPMSVVLGNADMMSVQIRGVNFDLTASTKDKVARFEVK